MNDQHYGFHEAFSAKDPKDFTNFNMKREVIRDVDLEMQVLQVKKFYHKTCLIHSLNTFFIFLVAQNYTYCQMKICI